MKKKSNELYQLNQKSLDKCSIQYLKLSYWKIAFKSNKTEHDEQILEELQMLLHLRHLISRLSNQEVKMSNADQYYCRVMAKYYENKLPVDYSQVRADATNLIRLLMEAKHTYPCSTCQRIIMCFTDFRMFICEFKHKELRCPFTLGPLGMPCLVCSMCFTMANIKASKHLVFFKNILQ